MTALPTDAPHSRAEYEAYFGKNYWPLLRPRYGLHMLGRALTTHAKDMPTVSTSRIPHMGRSCAELGGRSHYHIDLYGRYIPPSCPGLSLPLSALGAELDPEVYPIYTRLAQDPRSLLDFCKAQGIYPQEQLLQPLPPLPGHAALPLPELSRRLPGACARVLLRGGHRGKLN